MKILMISPQYKPIIGGYERAAEKLANGLALRGHKVTVVSERQEKSWPGSEYDGAVFVRRLWCIHRPRVHIATALASLAQFLLSAGRGYDVWHIHQYGAHAVLAISLGKLLKKPTILKLTSSGNGGIKQATSRLPFPSFCRKILLGVDQLVAPTDETEREALQFGFSPNSITRLGNAVELPPLAPGDNCESKRALREKLGISANGLVLFLGRLSEPKNPEGMIEAWKRVRALIPEGWLLALVGDGPLRAEIEQLIAKNGLSATVLLTGFRKDVTDWLGASDIFVLPSHHEGLSNSLLEAMAAELPVVATQVSGVSELLENTCAGIVSAVGDMDTFARSIAKLVNNEPLRAAMGKSGREYVSSRFSIEVVSQRYEQLYSEISHGKD